MTPFDPVRQVLVDAVARRVTPAAVVEIGTPERVLWSAAVGRLTGDPASPRTTLDVVFDLASLTKVVATTVLAMRLWEEGRLDIDAPVRALVPGWRATDRAGVRLVDLLEHASGLPAVASFHETMTGRPAFEAAICREALAYPPRTTSLYSDLGFMLLGFVLEDVGGAPLDTQVEHAILACGAGGPPDRPPGADRCAVDLRFCPPDSWRTRLAPTRRVTGTPPARHLLVDDENARALGGVAGHAGLFGSAAAVGWMARKLLRARLGLDDPRPVCAADTMRRFTTRSRVAGSSRALGWDTMLSTSSCGRLMSPEAFGHTGFTGTSLWLDPGVGAYVVLLTNRVYPAPGDVQGITALRRAVHDAVMGVLSGGSQEAPV